MGLGVKILVIIRSFLLTDSQVKPRGIKITTNNNSKEISTIGQ